MGNIEFSEILAWRAPFALRSLVPPLSGQRRLVIVSNEVEDRLLQLMRTQKVVGLQEFALDQIEPDSI